MRCPWGFINLISTLEQGVTGAVETTLKAVESLKAIPAWLLAGICLSMGMIWFVPDFQGLLPSDLKPWLPLGFFVVSVLLICLLISRLIAVVIAKRIRTAEREKLKYNHLYGPLRMLLLDCHITTVTGGGARRFSQRLKNAYEELSAYKRYKTGIRMAFRALFNKQEFQSSEVEYGDDFPLPQISKLAKEQSQYADEGLLNAIKRAKRSLYEDPSDGSLLTEAEYELSVWIYEQYRRLSRKFD